MSDNETAYFYRIKGLLVPKGTNTHLMHGNINRYIDASQDLAEALEKCFINRRTEFFIKNMETAVYLLNSVRARWLETEGEKILRGYKYDRIDQIRSLVMPFIANLISLSIEMQKAQNQEADEPNNLEEHADLALNLSAVETLISDGEYSQAKNMIKEIDELNPKAMLVNLFELVVAKQYDKAEKLANVLKEKHIEAIKEFGSEILPETKKMILAVDDMPEILMQVNQVLGEKYKVIGVTGGAAALKFLQDKKPDLFIFDIDMPGMDGCELARTVRRMEKHNLTPIIFLTGNSSREHVLNAMKAGGNDFIVKPADSYTLMTKVGKHLIFPMQKQIGHVKS